MSSVDSSNYVVNTDSVGEIKIAKEAICQIAALAAKDVDGVRDIAKTAPAKLANKIGFKMLSNGVYVSIYENEIEITINVILEEGVNVINVSSKIQEKIKSSIQNMTDFNVRNVDVIISGVDIK